MKHFKPIFALLITASFFYGCQKSEEQIQETSQLAPLLYDNDLNDLITINVIPSDTDTNIDDYTSPLREEKHICYLSKVAAKKNQLLVFLPGSKGKPDDNENFNQLAAKLGYHVIGLMYPNVPSIGSLCEESTDPDCYLKTRSEIIDGTNRTTLVNVDRANSIENRLIKCLKYLDINFPTQNWGQYLDASDNIIWSKIAIGGHSQGGGHAALIAKNRSVARVLCLASPKDNYRAPTILHPEYLGIIAPWINQDNLTPKESYYTFTHFVDQTGATPEEQQTIFDLLGLRQIADSINIDKFDPPYNNSRILMTYLKKANNDTIEPHGCVLVDGAVPDIESGNPNKYEQTWTYMLTH